MKLIHISQQAIKDNANLGTDRPVIAVHDTETSECTKHYAYTIAPGIRVIYYPPGQELDGSLIRVWIEVDE